MLKAFCLSATAHHAARTVGCSYPTAHRAFVEHRLAMADRAAEKKRPLLGELELDESYFGGKRKGKRGRDAAGKVAVFGILERDGKVYTVAVPDCKKETLMAKIEAATVKGSVFYTDEFSSYNELSRFGKHVPIDHGEVFADGPAHINDRGLLELCEAAAPALPRRGQGELPCVPGRVRVPVQSS